MKCIVLLFFLSLLSLDMALRREPPREERRTREGRPGKGRMEERRTGVLETPGFGSKDRGSFRDNRHIPGFGSKDRGSFRDNRNIPGFGSKDRGSFRDNRNIPGFGSKHRGPFRDSRNIPHGMDRMTIGRTSGHHAMERGRENFGDRQLIKGKYSGRTNQNSGRLGPTGAALAAAAVLTKRLEKPIEKAVKLGYIHPRS
ncbi:unnamed protein product [Cylicocyclus nassatus]|uniref:Uncharacterized protein n=1 Tax=Cylicocyclus nassatus TaxID=53992 RepID=A0AA36DL96_CYLNA|nr:unnamed protein product [Cylicocyclus nassatus]